MPRNLILNAGAGLLFLVACKGPQNKSEVISTPLKKENSIKYAKRFSISKEEGFTNVYLFGDKTNYDTTATYVIYSDSTLQLPSKGVRIHTPCKNIAALSSIYATMFYELRCLDKLVAIDNIDYVTNAQIIHKYEEDGLEELMKSPDIDLEKSIILHPDIIFTFGMGEGEKDVNRKLQQTGIPVAISVDHLEESPLARAEWIKFFAAFVDKGEMADSIFDQVEKNYFQLKKVAQNSTTRPTVFNEIKYSDSWFMPGGKSYVAQLLDDAGADYLWKSDTKVGSLPLSFEQVYAKAKDADFWINLSTLKTKKELLGFESRYSQFKAYQKGNLYNNTRHTNKSGYSSYWETGMIYPDRILSDLIQIFHPELKSQNNTEFYYYEQLK